MTSKTFRGQALRRSFSWPAAAIVAGLVVVTIGAKGREPAGVEEQGGDSCSVRTLHGSYGLLASGSRVIPFGPNSGKIEPIAGTGLRTYDGNGEFTERAADLHGQLTGVTPDPGGISGTYIVNDDCTGASTRWVPGLPFPIVANFVIINNGKSVKEAVMQPAANVITVLLDRR